MATVIDPVTGLPDLSLTPVDQIPLGSQLVDWHGLKASQLPPRAPVYPDDGFAVLSDLQAWENGNPDAIQKLYTDDNHALWVYVVNQTGGGGGTTPVVPTWVDNQHFKHGIDANAGEGYDLNNPGSINGPIVLLDVTMYFNPGYVPSNGHHWVEFGIIDDTGPFIFTTLMRFDFQVTAGAVYPGPMQNKRIKSAVPIDFMTSSGIVPANANWFYDQSEAVNQLNWDWTVYGV